MPWLVVASLLALTGCQAGAELEFHRPRLERLVPLALRRLPQPRVEVGLLDFRGHGVTDAQRITSGTRTWWMDRVQAKDFGVEGLKLHRAGGGGTQSLSTVVTSARFVPRLADHLVVVLDNSAAAALADPDERRIAALRTLVDRTLCRPSVAPVVATCEPRSDTRVSLILLQDASVQVVVTSSTERSELHNALAGAGDAAGGAALIWDGLDRGRRQLVHDAGGVLLVWSSSSDGGSKLSPAQVMGSWSAEAAPLYSVVTTSQLTVDTERWLTELSARNAGALLATTGPGDLQDVVLGASAAALQGRWELSLHGFGALSQQVLPGEYTGVGVLSLALGSSRWTSGFTLSLLPR